MYETLNEIGTSSDVDFILLGCPHASVDQIRQAAALLEGKRLSPVRAVDHGAARTEGDGRPLRLHRGDRAAGGRVLADSCPAMSRAAPAGTKVFATDSAKQAHYLPAILGIEAWFGTLEECVAAAITGRWNGGLD